MPNMGFSYNSWRLLYNASGNTSGPLNIQSSRTNTVQQLSADWDELGAVYVIQNGYFTSRLSDRDTRLLACHWLIQRERVWYKV